MGKTLSKIQSSVDEVAHDIGATLTTVANTIIDLRHDASGTMTYVVNECVESLHVIVHRANQTSFLLTNAVLGLSAAIALGILLYLTHFSLFLGAVVWIIYFGLCLHMVLTYVRHSRFPPSEGKVAYFSCLIHFKSKIRDYLTRMK
jgi:hypothetical protein